MIFFISLEYLLKVFQRGCLEDFRRTLIISGNQGVNTAIDKVEYVDEGYPLIKAGDIRGNFCIDDIVLSDEGIKDFGTYRVDASKTLWSDFFIPSGTPQVEELVFAIDPDQAL